MPYEPAPFATFRIGGQEILATTLPPGAGAHDPALGALLAEWPGRAYVQRSPGGTDLLLTRWVVPRRPVRTWVHALLFLVTLFTTTLAGALLAGGESLALRAVSVAGHAIPMPTDLSPLALSPGLWFSLPLLATLGAHELGHYALARRHGMDVTPPFFIPAPYLVSLIGTFGAFIRLRSPLLTRGALLEMAAAGPLAGFVVAVPVALAGLVLSTPVAAAPDGPASGVALAFGGVPELVLGEPLAFLALRWAAHGGEPVLLALHPMAFAGWIGFFFTALNLFPASQLDGGHVVYALSPRAHAPAGIATLAALLGAGMYAGVWLVWAVVILALSRGRLGHPPVVDDRFRLGRWRLAVGWACLLLFVLTVTPIPF